MALPRRQAREELHVVMDSTGWKVRQHGISKRRIWRKLHLAVDKNTQEVLMSVLSTNDLKVSEVFEDLIDPIEENIEQVSVDGAYATFNIHEYLKQKGSLLPFLHKKTPNSNILKCKNRLC